MAHQVLWLIFDEDHQVLWLIYNTAHKVLWLSFNSAQPVLWLMCNIAHRVMRHTFNTCIAHQVTWLSFNNTRQVLWTTYSMAEQALCLKYNRAPFVLWLTYCRAEQELWLSRAVISLVTKLLKSLPLTIAAPSECVVPSLYRLYIRCRTTTIGNELTVQLVYIMCRILFHLGIGKLCMTTDKSVDYKGPCPPPTVTVSQ